jgi:uncharacterized protein (TIGR00251 family)
MSSPDDALSSDPRGTVIAIEVTAGSRRAVFPDKYNPWRKSLGCRVASPPLEGKANWEIIVLFAKTFGVPSSDVILLSGAASSQKRILICGRQKDEVSAIIGRLL